MTKQTKKKGLPANYGGATPRQVAEAVLRYRPQKQQKPQPRRDKPASTR